jgi:4-amino-4-deoxy-L-arabinose transferase-like glycosyltransferase
MRNLKRSIVFEFFIIFFIVGASFMVGLKKTWFHPDESLWINQSYHFEDFFEGRFSAIAQQRTDYALTMPTIPEYVIGLSRRIGGYTPAQLNTMWDWDKSYEENQAIGSIPPEDMIWWARFLPALLGISSIIVTFYLIKWSFGVWVGYIWMVITVPNQWLISTLQRAMGESPLLFNIVIAMLAGYLAIKHFRSEGESVKSSLIWLIVFGAFTGLAGQTKLNGLAIFPAGIAILLLLTVKCTPRQRWRYFLIGVLGLSIFTFIFFVGTNPFYWSDPIGRTLQTLQFRVNMLQSSQPTAFPEIAINGWREHLQIDLEQIFKVRSSIQFANSNYLEMVLAFLGFSVLVYLSWTSYVKKSLVMNAGALSILLVGFLAGFPNLFTTLNIDRYFLLPVYFVSIYIAIGLNRLLKFISSIEPLASGVEHE